MKASIQMLGLYIRSLYFQPKIERYFSDVHKFPTNLYGKALPLQVWTGLEGSGRLRLPDFKTIGK